MSTTLHGLTAKGDTFLDGFQSTNELTGVAPTTTLATVECLVKNEFADTDAVAVLTLRTGGAGITITSAAAWTFTIAMTATQTATLTAGRYKWVCTTIDSSSQKQEAFRGEFTVTERGSDPSS